jgi:hypothetical protein
MTLLQRMNRQSVSARTLGPTMSEQPVAPSKILLNLGLPGCADAWS